MTFWIDLTFNQVNDLIAETKICFEKAQNENEIRTLIYYLDLLEKKRTEMIRDEADEEAQLSKNLDLFYIDTKIND